MPDPLWVDASAGTPAYSGQELRLSGIVPFVAGAGASLGARSGVRASGSGTDLLVQAQSSPNMSVKVNPGVIIVQGSISSTQGAYTYALDSVITRSIPAAHATLSRTDLIAVRIRDASIDTSGQRDGDVVVVPGTAGAGVPAMPIDATYIEIGRVVVGAAVTSIVSGNIADKRQFTAAAGGVIPCGSANEPVPTLSALGQPSYRTDRGWLRYSDGTNAQTIPRVLGGTQWTGTGNFFTGGLFSVEATVMASAGVSLPANTLIEVSAGIRVLCTGTASTFLFRIREGGGAGTQLREFTWAAPDTSFGYSYQFSAMYSTSTEVALTSYVVTAERLAGTGGLTVTGGGTAHNVHLMARAVGPVGALTIASTP